LILSDLILSRFVTSCRPIFEFSDHMEQRGKIV